MSDSQEVHDRVTRQFGPVASAYVTSSGHAKKDVLQRLVELVAPQPTDRVLDIATGAGHVALAFAPHVAESVALDLTPAMLAEVERAATERGLLNVKTVNAAAEEIPFEDATFDVVTVRLAPHHFASVPAFLAEAARVLRPSGKLLMVDTVAPEDSELDAEINRIELLRDPSHVRNYRPSEWGHMLDAAGFETVTSWVESYAAGTRMEFHEWVGRINAPQENRALLREAFQKVSPGLREVMAIRSEAETFTFELPELTLLARLC